MFVFLMFLSFVIGLESRATDDLLPILDISEVAKVATPKCKVQVLQGGPHGPVVNSVALDTELYYRVNCKSEGQQGVYCVSVFNCTVGSGNFSYSIINDFGCSLEPFLFSDVDYESDLVAGISNPYPVRFRGDENARLTFQCATSLFLKGEQDCDAVDRVGDVTDRQGTIGALGAQFEVQNKVKGVTVLPVSVPPTTTRSPRQRRTRRMISHRRGCYV